jgi:Domain of unknown function (DUF4440)
MTKYMIISFILFATIIANAQTKVDSQKIASLKKEILKMDSLLFDVAFNQCDTVLFKKILADDIEFYDDRSGLNNSKQVEINSLIEKCARPQKLTRKLNSCTIDKLGDFGAVQLGEHTFYIGDIDVGTAKFVQIWERKGGGWVVKRIVSYEHRSTHK